MKEIARELIKLEQELNHLPQADGIPIGSLLTDFWRQQYEQAKRKTVKNRHWFLQLLSVLKFVILFIFSSKQTNKPLQISNLLICKSGEKQHHKKLLDYIPIHIQSIKVVSNRYKEIYECIRFYSKLKILNRFLHTYFNVAPKLRRVVAEKRFSKTLLHLILAISLIKFYSAIEYFNFKKVKLVLVDYDRSNFAPIVLAANLMGIKTVTLQHGAINPPYGYVPVLANEIWVWGTLWKEYLIAMGEPEGKIKIAGSTIVDSFNLTQKIGQVQKIGIGPNPIGTDLNQSIWKPLISSLIKGGYDVMVKLHPSMDKVKEGEKVFGLGSKVFNANEIDNQAFFQRIDLLIVSSSSLGYEAVIAGIPVAVLKESKFSEGNDSIMVDCGGFPEIKPDDKINEVILKISNSLVQINRQEQSFIKNKIFDLAGKDAEQMIISKINTILNENP